MQRNTDKERINYYIRVIRLYTNKITYHYLQRTFNNEPALMHYPTVISTNRTH